uniref:Uncharacterized protein n=1 Tax=Timema monikensis TaxID=170555 RepID=A0A7R9EJI1_9NEOP|nr:unnamed protein product [Timema monikensis]
MESAEKISLVSPSKARKKKRHPGKWKHNCAKKLRYASPGLPLYPKCGNATKSFRCAALSMKQCLDFHHLYYENKDRVYQNVFLLKYCEVVPVAQRRPSTSSHKGKEFQSKFYVQKNVLKTDFLYAKQPNLVKMLKLLDVKRLLELHFSLNWHDNPLLAFYQPLIDSIQGAHPANDDVEEDEELICELMEESPEFCV